MRFDSLFGLILLSSCSAGPAIVKSEFSPGEDLTRFRSFDFYKFDASGDTTATFPITARAMQDAIAAELTNKGYVQDSDNPDLLVNIGLVVRQKAQTRQTNFRDDAPRYMGQRNYSWKSEEVVVGYYKEGTVTVDLVNRSTNSRIWEGIATDVVGGNSRNRQKQIQEAARLLLEKIPSKNGSGQ